MPMYNPLSGMVRRLDGLYEFTLYDTDYRWETACKYLLKSSFAALSRAFNFVGTRDHFALFEAAMMADPEDEPFCPACDAGVGPCNGPHRGNDEIPL